MRNRKSQTIFVKKKLNIPAPEPDPISDSSSKDSSPPEPLAPDPSVPESTSPDPSSPGPSSPDPSVPELTSPDSLSPEDPCNIQNRDVVKTSMSTCQETAQKNFSNYKQIGNPIRLARSFPDLGSLALITVLFSLLT